jgi:hypothetical protein
MVCEGLSLDQNQRRIRQGMGILAIPGQFAGPERESPSWRVDAAKILANQ